MNEIYNQQFIKNCLEMQVFCYEMINYPADIPWWAGEIGCNCKYVFSGGRDLGHSGVDEQYEWESGIDHSR